MTSDVESSSSTPRLERAERQIRTLRRCLVLLALGLLATILALFIPEVRLVLGAALWIVGILFAVLGFIAGVMWVLARLNRSTPASNVAPPPLDPRSLARRG
jgi:hypothetical protein